jgi:hypothetical protein
MDWTIKGMLDVDGHKFEVIVRPNMSRTGIIVQDPAGEVAVNVPIDLSDVGGYFLESGKEIREGQ